MNSIEAVSRRSLRPLCVSYRSQRTAVTRYSTFRFTGAVLRAAFSISYPFRYALSAARSFCSTAATKFAHPSLIAVPASVSFSIECEPFSAGIFTHFSFIIECPGSWRSVSFFCPRRFVLQSAMSKSGASEPAGL